MEATGAANGHALDAPRSLAQDQEDHDRVCELRTLECPAVGCAWVGRATEFANHAEACQLWAERRMELQRQMHFDGRECVDGFLSENSAPPLIDHRSGRPVASRGFSKLVCWNGCGAVLLGGTKLGTRGAIFTQAYA